MDALRRTAQEFLAQRRWAVAGVSRSGDSAANPVYRRLKAEGYEVVPVNPSTDEVEGDPCFPSVGDVPGGVDVVLVATAPGAALAVARDCVDAGVPRVWFHRSFGTGSVDTEAVATCESAGLAVIGGACPMMFLDPVDVVHRCMRWVLDRTGGLPEPDGTAPDVRTEGGAAV